MNRLGYILTLTAFGLLAAPETVQSATPTYLPAIKRAFSFYLKDPSSVQIEVAAKKADAICGRFNARNSFGGYVGFKFFSYEPSTGDLYLIGTIIHRSGAVDDAMSMIKNLPSDPDEFKKRVAAGEAINSLTVAKIKGCVDA